MKDNSKYQPQEIEGKWPRKTPAELRGKQSYNPNLIETKWQQYWERVGVYQPDLKNAKRPYYNLMMFPYPSAEGLHVGNMYAFTGADINGRYKRMRGYDVFEPIGLDGFGIHSENYAIKIGKHPAEQAKISEKNFYRQLHAIGNGFAWENRLETYDPDYYRWTQWIFVQMFKHGLAYRKKSPVNFCPSCKTVLSDEQVIDGFCERCKSAVEKKEMEQWYFRITKYAERLLKNLETLEWTNKVKVGQKNWIGKKEGINITYSIIDPSGQPVTRSHLVSGRNSNLNDDTEEKVTVFTTRPDTNFGATFVVIGPEHPFVNFLITTPFARGPLAKTVMTIKSYIEKTKSKSEAERIAEGRKKTGVFTGFYAINELNGYKMPIWVSDFVLGHVGTGAVVGVPGHDLRDFEFAKEFQIPIIRVVIGKDGDKSEITRVEQVQEEEGIMINSGFLDGLEIQKAISAMMVHLEKKGWGKRVVTYKLRDWCISRQRYWGAPIPMVFCQSCADKDIGWLSIHSQNSPEVRITNQESRKEKISRNSYFVIRDSDSMPGWYPVADDQLPVLLPDNVKDWKPEGTGKGPLAKLKDWVKVACPECRSQSARRETDVCDTFLDSSWYHLRYPSVNMKIESGRSKVGVEDRGSKVEKNNPPSIINSPPLSSAFNHLSSNPLPWDPQITQHWLPVTQYIGGAEHTVLHLLYARFVWMCFYDWGCFPATMSKALGWDEPYTRFYAHGLIIAEGAKMSKSRGNVVVPDAYIEKYGADTLRTYLMFLGPFDSGGDFRDTGIAGMYRFLWRVWRLVNESLSPKSPKLLKSLMQEDGLKRIMHHTIKEVTEDMENLRYNTAIAHIMEYVNHLTDNRQQITKNNIETLLLLLAPFSPHMCEELWQALRHLGGGRLSLRSHDSPDGGGIGKEVHSIHLHPWPMFDPKYLVEDVVTIVVQVNGKTRDVIKVKSDKDTSDGGPALVGTPRAAGKAFGDARPRWRNQNKVEKLAKKSEKVQKYLSGKTIRKVIFIPGKLINFVV